MSGMLGMSNNASAGPDDNPNTVDNNPNTVITFSNPLNFDTVEGILTSLLNNLRGIIVVLSIIFIIIGAILYITSAGREKQITLAKNAILASMIGLAIGIAAPSFLKEISKILGWNTSNSDVSGALTLTQIALNTLNFLLGIVGILAIIMLVIGGMTYLTAAGDDDKIKTGKNIFKWSVVGITLALASMVIRASNRRLFSVNIYKQYLIFVEK